MADLFSETYGIIFLRIVLVRTRFQTKSLRNALIHQSRFRRHCHHASLLRRNHRYRQ